LQTKIADHYRVYQWHDYRLVKLRQLIRQHRRGVFI
jgi:hypothetical protein